MKKNLLIKTLTSIGAVASLSGALTNLSSCSNNLTAKITITNKISELFWLGEPYQVKVNAEHLDGATVLFSSSNQAVATIDEQGYIHAVGNGTTIIKAYSNIDASVSDQFELSVNALYIKGIITDSENKPLSGVNVSWEGKTNITGEDGKYEVTLSSPTSVIYFEKLGYVGQAYGSSFALASEQHELNVSLISYDLGQDITVNGTVTDWNNVGIPSCSVTLNAESEFHSAHATTDSKGNFSTTVRVNPANPTVSVIIHNAAFDAVEEIREIKSGQIDPIKARPYQYDVKAYVGNDHNNEQIIMHAYHAKQDSQDGLLIQLESNFAKAFNGGNEFKITINKSHGFANPKRPDITQAESSKFEVAFKCDKSKIKWAGDLSQVEENKIDIQVAEDKYHMNVFIPGSFFTDAEKPVCAIHLDSSGRGTFTPYEHAKFSTSAQNELSYVRLDANDALYPASDNYNIMNLDWDTKSGDDWKITNVLGTVASKYNFGYQVKIAKNVSSDPYVNGLYIMTKYTQDQMCHYLPDGWQPHFFFYTKQLTNEVYPTDPVDETIKHIAPISGYWMQSYTVKSSTEPFTETQEYDQIYKQGHLNSSPKVYAKDDLMITYIPYSFLGEGFDATKTFGFACNLQYLYTGGEWHAWQDANPTGYIHIPHFEETTSYIQFRSDMSIIPYN